MRKDDVQLVSLGLDKYGYVVSRPIDGQHSAHAVQIDPRGYSTGR